MAANPSEIDKISGVATTGHEWDGLKELNNPLPRWWLWTFYATVIWSLGYVVVYPAIPLVSTYTKGVFGFSTRGSVEDELAALRAQRAGRIEALSKAKLEDVAKDAELLDFTRRYAKVLFGDNCAACHGQGANGGKGFPSLVDDDWLWGGTMADIYKTITVGIRSTHADTRPGNMPALGRTKMISPEDVEAVADYTLSLSGLKPDDPTRLEKGAAVFKSTCADCHGPEGKGKPDVGAPNLTDAIWLYGSDRKTIVATIQNGRGQMMPHWTGRLDEAAIKALTIYVHGLGGGK